MVSVNMGAELLNKFPCSTSLTELASPIIAQFGNSSKVFTTQVLTLENVFDNTAVEFLVVPSLSTSILFGQSTILKFSLYQSSPAKVHKVEVCSKEIQVEISSEVADLSADSPLCQKNNVRFHSDFHPVFEYKQSKFPKSTQSLVRSAFGSLTAVRSTVVKPPVDHTSQNKSLPTFLRPKRGRIKPTLTNFWT
jgi:hypothetical protein